MTSSGVGSRFTMISRAPARFATRGMDAAGSTTRDDPTASSRSQASADAYARTMTSCGIACPKETVAGLSSPPHGLQRGAGSPPATRRHASSIGIRSPQDRQTASVEVPCSSMTSSAGSPERWCRRSMFWVISAANLPCSCSATNAWCPALGRAARMAGQPSTFCRQYSTRSASLETNSWK